MVAQQQDEFDNNWENIIPEYLVPNNYQTECHEISCHPTTTFFSDETSMFHMWQHNGEKV